MTNNKGIAITNTFFYFSYKWFKDLNRLTVNVDPLLLDNFKMSLKVK